MICRLNPSLSRHNVRTSRSRALAAATLALVAQGCFAQGCLSIDGPTPDADTDPAPGTSGADETGGPSGPCTKLTQTDVDVDLELAAGCYEVDTLLSIDSARIVMGPGVEVSFAQFAGLFVSQSGVLRAVGAQGNPVVFRGQTEERGSWQGLSFLAAPSSDNRLEHVEIHHAGPDSNNTGALALSNGTRLTVTNTTISESPNFAISVEASELTLSASTLADNGAALRIPNATVPGIGEDNVFQNNTRNVVVVTGDNLSANATWRDVGIPYHPEGWLHVQADLTLNPGVTIAMAKDTSIAVQTTGSLRAEGTAAAPITFTGQQAEVGYWQGLSIQSKASSNVCDHCIVEYGGSTAWTGNGDTRALFWQPDGSKVVIRNSTLRHSGFYGVYVETGADISGFQNNRIENNARIMHVHPNQVATIEPSNVFENNTEQKIRTGYVYYDAIETSQTWPRLSVPYFAVEDFIVTSAWTIEAGTTIEMAQDKKIIVENGGSISAIGTAADPITIRGADSVPGYWIGLQIGTVASANRLEHTILDHGGSYQWHGGADSEAALYSGGVGTGHVSLANVTIRNSGGNGILIQDGSSVSCSGVTFQSIAKANVSGTGANGC